MAVERLRSLHRLFWGRTSILTMQLRCLRYFVTIFVQSLRSNWYEAHDTAEGLGAFCPQNVVMCLAHCAYIATGFHHHAMLPWRIFRLQ